VKIVVRHRKRNRQDESGDNKHPLRLAELLKLRVLDVSASGTGTPLTQPSTPFFFPQSLASSIDPLSHSTSFAWPADSASALSTSTQCHSHLHITTFEAPPTIPRARGSSITLIRTGWQITTQEKRNGSVLKLDVD